MLASVFAKSTVVEVMTIPQFSHADRLSEIAHALGEAGCVVVTDLLRRTIGLRFGTSSRHT
jgi:hypothetical protein